MSSLSPPPTVVDVSIVTQTVTARHSQKLTPEVIKVALDDAGFDIVTTPDVVEYSRSFTGSVTRLQPTLSRKRLKHVQQCPQCQQEQEHGKSCDARDKLGEDTLFSEIPELKKTAIEYPLVLHEKEVNTLSQITPVTPSAAAPSGPYHVTLSIGGMTCASCSNTLTRVVSELPGVSDAVVNLLGNSATATVDKQDLVQSIVEAIEDAGYDADIVSTELANRPAPAPRQPLKAESDGPFRVTLSVGGMTCASCTNTITGLTSDIPGISDVAVSLLGKSATAVITRKELADQLVETIEDAGYEAEVVNLEPIHSETDFVSGPRTIALRVEGLFCKYASHCAVLRDSC